MMYPKTSPKWLRKIQAPGLVWEIPVLADKPTVYFTFDDGPHPTITPWVLEQLKAYQAEATFFCIGENVLKHPEIYQRVLDEGHTVGNHTMLHKDGWKCNTEEYLVGVEEAAKHIDSKLFRPPYGKIKFAQAKALQQAPFEFEVIMWSVLSADFDDSVTPQESLGYVLNNVKPGSIIVFHDAQKPWPRLEFALPRALAYCKERQWQMKALPNKTNL